MLTNVYTTNGNASDTAAWSLGRLPVSIDHIIISGHCVADIELAANRITIDAAGSLSGITDSIRTPSLVASGSLYLGEATLVANSLTASSALFTERGKLCCGALDIANASPEWGAEPLVLLGGSINLGANHLPSLGTFADTLFSFTSTNPSGIVVMGDVSGIAGSLDFDGNNTVVSGDFVIQPEAELVHAGISGTSIAARNITVRGLPGSRRKNFNVEGGVNVNAVERTRFEFTNVGNVVNDGPDASVHNFVLTQSVDTETHDSEFFGDEDTGDLGTNSFLNVGQDYFRNRCCFGCDSSGTPIIIEVTLQDMESGTCENCASYNGTYTLYQVYNWWTPEADFGIGQGACRWLSCFDDPCNPGTKALLGFQLGLKGTPDGFNDSLLSQIYLNTGVETDACCEISGGVIISDGDFAGCLGASWSQVSYRWLNATVGTDSLALPTNCFNGITAVFQPADESNGVCDHQGSTATITLASGTWVECPLPRCCCMENLPEASRPAPSGDGEEEEEPLDRCFQGLCLCNVYLQFDLNCLDRSFSDKPTYASLYGDGTSCGTAPCEQAIVIANGGDCEIYTGDWCISYDCTDDDSNGNGVKDASAHPYGTEHIAYQMTMCPIDHCDPHDCVLSSHELIVGLDGESYGLGLLCSNSECGPSRDVEGDPSPYLCLGNMTGPSFQRFILQCNFPAGSTALPTDPSLYTLWARFSANQPSPAEQYTDTYEDCEIAIPTPWYPDIEDPEQAGVGFVPYAPISVVRTPAAPGCVMPYGIEIVFAPTVSCDECVKIDRDNSETSAPFRSNDVTIGGDTCEELTFNGDEWRCDVGPTIVISMSSMCA